MKIVITSGYLNPLHIGHLRLINEAKKLGDKLLFILNSDKQVELKGSYPFMKEEDRLEIVKSLRNVDHVVLAIDETKNINKTLEIIFEEFNHKTPPWEDLQFIFAKGGDRRSDSCMPEEELEICRRYDCQIVYGVGGFEKANSSSELIANAKKMNLNLDEKGV